MHHKFATNRTLLGILRDFTLYKFRLNARSKANSINFPSIHVSTFLTRVASRVVLEIHNLAVPFKGESDEGR